VKCTVAREAEDSMVAYLGKQRERRTQKETKHREKHFIIASTSVPPNNVPTTVKYLQISNFTAHYSPQEINF